MKPAAFRSLALTLVGCSAIFLSTSLSARPFTNTKGQVIEAEFQSSTETTVTIVRTADGKKYTIPIASLSKEDQDFIAEQVEQLRKAEAEENAPHPDVKPGASLKIPFPNLVVDRRGEPATLGVKIPSSYDPAETFPLFVWMAGGQGGNRPTTSGVVDGERFISVGLPYPKGANSPFQSNMVGDFDTIWNDYHRPMLVELFERIPNIDRRLCILAGFSNGGHCIAGVLQEAKDGGYPEFFNCFVLVDGGIPTRRLKGGKGNYLFATWGQKSPNARTTEESANKASGMEVEKFEMPETGHNFAQVGKDKVKKWLDGVVIPATLKSTP